MFGIDINLVYDTLINKLREANQLTVFEGIENSSAGAVTGSEALGMQGSHLVSLKYSNPTAFKLTEQEVIKYLEYCKQHGLIIRE
jgi:hypothetical protein